MAKPTLATIETHKIPLSRLRRSIAFIGSLLFETELVVANYGMLSQALRMQSTHNEQFIRAVG
jgi:hypothetical protein